MHLLRDYDLEEIKIKAGYGQDPVTLDRETFDQLIEGYKGANMAAYNQKYTHYRENLCTSCLENKAVK